MVHRAPPLHGPAGVRGAGPPGWSLTSHLFFLQVLQGKTDGVVFDVAGDDVRHGPLPRAVTLSRVPAQGVGFVEMPQHRMDYQII